MRSRWAVLLLALTGWLVTNGCQYRFRTEFAKLREGRGNNEEQRLAAYAESFKHIALQWDGTKNEYQTSFRRITLEKFVEQLDARLEDFRVILNYNNADEARYVEFSKKRAKFERQEQIIRAQRDRAKVALLDNKFQTLMGTHPYYWGPETNPLDIVDIKKIYAGDDFRKTYLFESDLVNEARKNGILQLVEDFVWVGSQTYGKKEPDISDPTDRFKFDWQPLRMALRFRSYKVVNGQKPKDNEVDYIEGVRILVDHRGNRLSLQEESRPALKIFVLGSKAVVVADQDKEMESGFGLPEIVEGVDKIFSAQILMRQEVVQLLFPEKPQDKRRPPPVKPDVKVEVALVGVPVDLWEKASVAAGWKVPFSYRNTKGDNYSVKVLVVPKKDTDTDNPDTDVRQIDYVAKIYTGNGLAVEYYRTKTPFNERNVMRAVVEDGKRIRIEFSNGDSRNVTVPPGNNIFIEDRPYRIVFTEGDKRYVIWDKDNDGKYELRLETAIDGNSDVDPGSSLSAAEHTHYFSLLDFLKK